MNPTLTYHKVYEELAATLENYSETFNDSYHKRQENLIRILRTRAHQLKTSIQQLRKKTSQESIDKLISKKKQEKEGEREKLEKQWRELTQKLKKLQAQDKKLANENKQASFDIKNLHKKIKQLEIENENLEGRIESMKGIEKEKMFITEYSSKPYASPYKCMRMQRSCGKSGDLSEASDFDGKLKTVQEIQMVPEQILNEFLSQRQIKLKIYSFLFP